MSAVRLLLSTVKKKCRPQRPQHILVLLWFNLMVCYWGRDGVGTRGGAGEEREMMVKIPAPEAMSTQLERLRSFDEQFRNNARRVRKE